MTNIQLDLYRELIENLPVAAVYIIEERLYLNRKASELTGYTSEELKTVDDWFNLYGPKTTEIKKRYLEGKSKKFAESARVLFTKKNGEVRFFDFTGSLTSNLEIWAIDDVTEKILVEERFTVLFEHSTDAHLLFDKTGIIDCNNAAVKMLNANSKEEVLAHHPAHFSPEFQPCGMRSMEKNKIIDKLAHDRGYHRFEWVHKKLTGEEFFVEVTLNPVDVANQKMLLVIWHDLTNIKEAQRKLEEERSLSFNASKMATLGEMASGIAHEINNPLTVILNKAMQISRAVCEETPDIREIGRHSDKIFSTVGRISKIVRGLRNFARDGANDPMEAFTLKTIVTESLDLCQSRFSTNGIELKLIALPDEKVLENKIFCVNIQIEQVLINLLNNAHDAVSSVPGDHCVSLTVKVVDNFAFFIVEDTGPGVPIELREKIMMPFFTTKEVGKGTGIGLSISKGIVEKHNGKLTLDLESKTTKFVVSIPLFIES